MRVHRPLATWTSSMPFTGMVVGPKASTRARRWRRSTVPRTPKRTAVALHHEPHEVVVAALATRNRLLVRTRHQDSDEPVVAGTAAQDAGAEAAEEEIGSRATQEGVRPLPAAQDVVTSEPLDPVVALEGHDDVGVGQCR